MLAKQCIAAARFETTGTPEQTDRLSGHLQPLVEHGDGTQRTAVSYLWAQPK